MRVALGIMLLLAATAGVAQPPAPCSRPEHRQFDFWVGEWEVFTPDEKKAGENTIRKILNDCALQESWRGEQGSIGQSLNMYYSGDSKWHQSWVDGNGGRLDLSGGLDGSGRMVLSGEMLDRKGDKVLHEITWQPLAGGEVKQHWRVSRDRGSTWQDAFLGIYRPFSRPPDADEGGGKGS